MSYAIVRNEKLTRSQAKGSAIHKDRKVKNHSNKEIDISKTHLNYYLKNNELNYLKEFDKFKITLKKFIKWICKKFSYPSEDEIIRDFYKETYINFNIENGLDINEFKKKEKSFDREL